MLNRVTIAGRLTADPELRQTPNGISVTSFSIANQRNYKNADGERNTDFYDVTAWRSNAEFATKHFTKGSLIIVDGNLETDRYIDKNGNNRTSVKIVADNLYFGNSKTESQKSDTGDFVPDFSAVADDNSDEFPFDSFSPLP